MIKKILIRMLAVTLMLIFCFVMLLLCVKAGLALFGETAFGYEQLPGITEPCGLSTEELEAVLKHDLKPYAEAFIHAEEDYDINAVFLCSVAAAESGWGRYRHQKNNIFGFMTSMEFESVEHNIDFVAWFLRKHYLQEHGRYYRGGTIEAVGSIWCPDNGEWAELVSGIYANFYK